MMIALYDEKSEVVNARHCASVTVLVVNPRSFAFCSSRPTRPLTKRRSSAKAEETRADRAAKVVVHFIVMNLLDGNYREKIKV